MIELADTSAWYGSVRDPVLERDFHSGLIAREIVTCEPVKLELLRGARNPADFARRRRELDALGQCPIPERLWRRAMDVYQALCDEGPGNDYHRRVGHVDLLIAAAAEAAGVPVLHYDADFDAIAAVTGQAARWIAPAGSL